MQRITNTTPRTIVSSNHAADQKLWYISDPRIRTHTAARNAAHIAERANTASGVNAELEEQALFAALHTCAFQVARRPNRKPITKSQRTLWGRRWQSIHDYIAEKNLGLVHLISRRFQSGVLDEDDLLSEGMCALGRAIDRFNPWRGFRFSTYACNVIRRALLRRRKGEIRYRNFFPVQHDASYEKPTEPVDYRKELCLERLRRALDCNLGALSDLEASVLSHRFVTEECRPKRTFQEIGRVIGLSKERVRQIQNIALKKLREVLQFDPVLQ
jgi:RNA polymerase primary sigma factor